MKVFLSKLVVKLIVLLVPCVLFSQTWAEYDSISSSYYAVEKYDSAVLYSTKALQLAERNIEFDNNTIANILQRLVYSNYFIEDYKSAIIYCEREYELRSSSYPENVEAFISCSNVLGLLNRKLGQNNEALNKYNGALSLIEKHLSKSHPEYGSVTNNIANLYRHLGEFDKASSYYSESLNNSKQNYGEISADYVISLNNLANFHKQIGQFDRAYESFEKISKLIDSVNDISLNGKAIFYTNYANLAREMKKTEDADFYFNKALKTFEDNEGLSKHDYATCLTGYGGFCEDLGNYDKSLSIYHTALDLFALIYGEDNYYYGLVCNNLANVYAKKSDFLNAEYFICKAIKNTKQNLGTEHFEYAVSLINHGQILTLNGNDNLAVDVFGNAVEILNKNIDKAFTFLPENDQYQFINNINNRFEIVKNFYYEKYHNLPSITVNAYNIELLNKNMVLNAGKNLRKGISSSDDQELLIMFDNWMEIRNELANYSFIPNLNIEANIDKLANDADSIEKLLMQKSEDFIKHNRSICHNWLDIKNSLNKDEIAIEFVTYNKKNALIWTDTVIYAALIIRADSDYPSVVKLFCQNELLKYFENSHSQIAINNLYRGVILFQNKNGENRNDSLPYDLIWRPLEDYLSDINSIFYTSTGLLHKINLAALKNDSTYVSDKYKLLQFFSTADIIKHKTRDSLKIDKVIIFGGIDYENYDTTDNKPFINSIPNSDYYPISKTGTYGYWNFLHGSWTESLNVYTYLFNHVDNLYLFSGKVANKKEFKSISGKKSPDILHIATHGFYNDNQISSENKATTINNNYKTTFINSMNKTGLVLAGANKDYDNYVNKTADNGILTAYEISNLDLQNTKLVVLSACETGLGDIENNEGVFGLQRAFKLAGAKYIVMSLWPVPDKETAEFMQYFYQEFIKSNNIELAFYRAQNIMKQNYYKNPYVWAAFILKY